MLRHSIPLGSYKSSSSYKQWPATEGNTLEKQRTTMTPATDTRLGFVNFPIGWTWSAIKLTHSLTLTDNAHSWTVHVRVLKLWWVWTVMVPCWYEISLSARFVQCLFCGIFSLRAHATILQASACCDTLYWRRSIPCAVFALLTTLSSICVTFGLRSLLTFWYDHTHTSDVCMRAWYT